MSVIERSINVFEKRVEALGKITDIRNLPQWTDADVIAAHCLINQYRKFKNATNQALDLTVA